MRIIILMIIMISQISLASMNSKEAKKLSFNQIIQTNDVRLSDSISSGYCDFRLYITNFRNEDVIYYYTKLGFKLVSTDNGRFISWCD